MTEVQLIRGADGVGDGPSTHVFSLVSKTTGTIFKHGYSHEVFARVAEIHLISERRGFVCVGGYIHEVVYAGVVWRLFEHPIDAPSVIKIAAAMYSAMPEGDHT